jgi:hypothetical protein
VVEDGGDGGCGCRGGCVCVYKDGEGRWFVRGRGGLGGRALQFRDWGVSGGVFWAFSVVSGEWYVGRTVGVNPHAMHRRLAYARTRLDAMRALLWHAWRCAVSGYLRAKICWRRCDRLVPPSNAARRLAPCTRARARFVPTHSLALAVSARGR